MHKVMVFGTFDKLHPGHEYFLKKARGLGDMLVVVVARDSTVLKVKKHDPLFNEERRKADLESSGLADKVLLGNDGADKYISIREEKPDVIALGYDQKFFIDDLTKQFPSVKIVRLDAFKPDTFKSSKLNYEE